MSALACLLLGLSVTMLTRTLWPRRPTSPSTHQFVEDGRIPRTLH